MPTLTQKQVEAAALHFLLRVTKDGATQAHVYDALTDATRKFYHLPPSKAAKPGSRQKLTTLSSKS